MLGLAIQVVSDAGPDIGPECAIVLGMKRVSIQDLKAQLSAAIIEAESGNTIIVTRHNEPVAQLGPARPQHVQRGEKVGTGQIKPALRRATRGRYLSALNEDRSNL